MIHEYISDTRVIHKRPGCCVPIHNLIEYSNNFTKTLGRLWRYQKDDSNDNIKDSEKFKFSRISGRTPAADSIKDVEIVVSLKYLSNF